MSETQCNFEIARTLGPGDAPEVCAALLAWLARQPKTGSATGQVDLGPGEAVPSPLAVQLLVAADRTRSHGPVRFGPRARTVLDVLGTPSAPDGLGFVAGVAG